ncbi:FKBP-type peptidyl-prolyl cis-trans isomerase [Tatumella terrea]|uniref:FKBP-type peptidyl-prolyl cis-trans isomerase n=1 Tax=Tatumella TaxID=82986 RepID=UPI001BB047E8|nr:FKBP-type peptidyl-prolyl cis-trans isomerase [Tatumella sp. JGM118]MBS0908855.1 FKBP-type peptidyl-prolyl cis-trans isomerase [Tatumella sp. JGM118]
MSYQVQHDSSLLVHFTLTLEDGSLAESTRANGKPALFRLGDGSLSPAFGQALSGMTAGETRQFTLTPEDAFGPANPDLIQYFSRRDFAGAAEPETGTIMLFTAIDGSEMPGIIRDVSGDSVTVDFNHPLAGQTVTFAVEVLEVDPVLENENADSAR